jgi:hypothetical protein
MLLQSKFRRAFPSHEPVADHPWRVVRLGSPRTYDTVRMFASIASYAPTNIATTKNEELTYLYS